MAFGDWPVEVDETDAALRALLAEFEADGQVDGFLETVEDWAETAEKAGVPGAGAVKDALETVNGQKRKKKAKQRQEAQRQELEEARRDKAVREAEDRADARAEQQERLQRNRIRLLEDALRDRVAQVTQLVQERQRIRARIAELEAEEAGWSTEAKVVAGLASIGTLVAVLRLLSDRGT